MSENLPPSRGRVAHGLTAKACTPPVRGVAAVAMVAAGDTLLVVPLEVRARTLARTIADHKKQWVRVRRSSVRGEHAGSKSVRHHAAHVA